MSTKIYASQDYVSEALKDKISVPISVTVGQTIVVKSVDENGKPTEWEAVDQFVLTDEDTGAKYKLSVSNGKLEMAEVNA
jgi:hypothetical protein